MKIWILVKVEFIQRKDTRKIQSNVSFPLGIKNKKLK
jgi:hypothetical protein